MKVTILGCGPSIGVPAVGGNWGVCDPDEPRNRRCRSSILVEHDGAILMVDTTPDCRAQLLAANVSRLDAVLYTHAHADHCHGIDDLRSVNMSMKADLPAYGSAETLASLDRRFGYVFEALRPDKGYYKPKLMPHIIDGPFAVGSVSIVPFEQNHGFSRTLGFRFGSMAYSTDFVELDDAAFDALEGIDTWIVDCFRRSPHPTHTHLERTLAYIKRLKPSRAVLTHMGSDMDYATLCAELPAGVEPGYDGMVVEEG
jgi:phosphoribosyl 1,2-cyclic phosphate phosphodiesterase